MSMHHNNTNNRHRGSFHDGGDVDLGALYAGAVECARKEVELAAMCFAYRAKRADRPRHEVSGKILRALEAAGCAGRNKVCACSLGMFECFKVRGHVEHFGDWTGGLRADDGFAELTRRAVSRLQARHDEALRAAGSDRRELSITRLYGVFVEWTPRSRAASIKAAVAETLASLEDEEGNRKAFPAATGASLKDEEEIHDGGTMNGNEKALEEDGTEREGELKALATAATEAEGGRVGNDRRLSNGGNNKRKRQASLKDDLSGDQVESSGEDDKGEGGGRGCRRERSTPSSEVAIATVRQRIRSTSSTTTKPRRRISATFGHSKRRPASKEEEAGSGEEEQITEDDSEEKESATPSEGSMDTDDEMETKILPEEGTKPEEKKKRQKLRAPFRPPKGMRAKPCHTTDGGRTWHEIGWDERHDLSDRAWIQPIREFFRVAKGGGELERLKEEDRTRVKWKQDFERCYGVFWPLRHIGAFMATEEVEASVSHRDTGKEGRHLVLSKCGNIDEFPARQALIDRLNKEWKNDLGKGHAFNAVQSNLYSGVGPNSDDSVSSLDHIGFHKNGRCKTRGPPIVGGCYSNNASDEETTAAFLIHHQTDTDIRVWIPQASGTGYAFGGKHCHKKYYHGKFLFGNWRAYHHHVSITFSCYHPWTRTAGNNNKEEDFPPPGADVSVDWNLTAEARLWSRRYLLGQVPKSACHSEVLRANKNRITASNYESVWGAWDEFANASILQLLQLHPADGGQGIAGNGDHALSILLMNNPRYPNRVTVDRQTATLRVEYYAGSDRGEGLLERAMKDLILVRVFLSPNVPARASLFAGDPSALLLLPLMIVVDEGKDATGVFFVLLAHLSTTELDCRTQQPCGAQ